MFSRFTRHGGKHTTFIRADRIYSMSDTESGECLVSWDGGEMAAHVTVDGTAAENYARLQHEELEAIRQAESMERRMQPMTPRGRVRP